MALTKVVFDMASGVEAADAAILKSDETSTLTVGYNVTTFNAGTKTTGTFTPAPASGNIQRAVNGGAFILSPPVTDCVMIIQITNNASAGAVTTSGFSKVEGTLTTTNGDDFLAYITRINGFTLLSVRALQ
tara:strand:+ start:137 stop:529 length:393 start_codon:yes stop_codon:yes gene_type:complete